MKSDPLVDEVREARREISAEHGDDIHRLLEHYRQRQRELKRTGGRKLIGESSGQPVLREERNPYKS